jgi:drug/metabolite transporter (DMT)-like permease
MYKYMHIYTYTLLLGDLWALGQPLFFGLGFWRIETFMKDSRAPGDAQAFTGAMMISVATGAWIWTLQSFILPHLNDNTLASSLVHERLALNDWHVLAAIGWTGIVTTALTAFGENYAMKSLSASESTVIYSTEPLWGTAFAAVALGETVGVNTLVGAALILSACVWSTVGPAISVAGALATTQVALGEGLAGFAEVLENVHINWTELIERATER